MDTCLGLGLLMRRAAGMTFAGAALLLVGKIATVLMIVVTFVGVGFLVWRPLHASLFGKSGPRPMPCPPQRLMRVPLESGRRQIGRFNAALEEWVPFIRDLLLEVACGAIVGILVAVAAQTSSTGAVIGAALGGMAGFGVACRRHAP